MAKTMVFLDSRVNDLDLLVSQFEAGSEYRVLDTTSDGLLQMQESLAGRSGYDSIQIFSHGSPGSLMLGSTTLSLENITSYAATLSQIGTSLSPAGDILLYGCNVGAGDIGQAFVDSVARLTQANVAASDDLTGSAALGGDWVLEVESGVVESSGFFDPEYSGLLGAVGAEFQVNTYTKYDQRHPSVTTLSDGGFVITWQSTNIYGQRYNADGLMVGSEFQVNTYNNQSHRLATVTSLTNGGFVVTWIAQNGTFRDLVGYDIHGQRYNSDGLMVGSEFQVNTYTQQCEDIPSVTALANGGFVVTWRSNSLEPLDSNIHGQLYNANGAMIGSEFQVNTDIQGTQWQPSVASLSDGGFVVTWESVITDPLSPLSLIASNSNIHGQRYNADGTMVGSEFQINPYSQQYRYSSFPSIASLSDGGFVVTYTSNNSSGYGIYGQRYNADGTMIGSEFQINPYSQNYQNSSAVASLSNGGFVVTWTAYDLVYNADIYGQCYNADGTMVGAEFQVNSYTQYSQNLSALTSLSNDGFVVTWESFGGEDGDGYGIYARIYDNSPSTGLLSLDLLDTNWSNDGNGKYSAEGSSATLGLLSGNSTMLYIQDAKYTLTGDTLIVDGEFSAIIEDITRSLFIGKAVFDVTTGVAVLTVGSSFYAPAEIAFDFTALDLSKNYIDLHFSPLELPAGISDTHFNLESGSFVIKENDPQLGFNDSVNFPDKTFELFDMLSVQANDWSVSYDSLDNEFHILGGFELQTGWDNVPGINAELTGDGLVIRNGEFADVALTITLDDFSVKGWGFNDVSLTLDTAENSIVGSAGISYSRFENAK